MILNMTGGSGAGKSRILVTAPAGSEVTCVSAGGETRTAAEQDGTWMFSSCGIGTWTVTATLGDQTAAATVEIREEAQLARYYVVLSYGTVAADFDWTAFGTLGVDYEIVDDGDTPIPEDQWTSAVNWKARLLTTNTLTPRRDVQVDVFCVGGGADGKIGSAVCHGGGGGYTNTAMAVAVTGGVAYPIVVGASGGETSAFGCKAAGADGRKGGSGGGYGGRSGVAGGNGASDGNDTTDGNGKGQRSTPGPNGETGSTREFGEETGRLYAGGGGGGSGITVGLGGEGGGADGVDTGPGMDGEPNTGGGGGGAYSVAGGKGASGIVVIRPAGKEAA